MQVILRRYGKDQWSGIPVYKNCSTYLGSYFTRSGNLYTGLTKEDEKRLEEDLNYPEGTLRPTYTDPNSQLIGPNKQRILGFWETFFIKVTGNQELTLDTSRPEDELKYLFLRNHKRVANGLGDRKPGVEFILVNKETEAEEVNKINKTKRRAIKEFDKLSPEQMRKCLRLYGVNSENSSNEVVEAKLFELIEKDPAKFFMKWVDNNLKDLEFLIEEAVANNIIRKNKTVYKYGTDMIGGTLDEAISYLNNPVNRDLKLTIQTELEAKNEYLRPTKRTVKVTEVESE